MSTIPASFPKSWEELWALPPSSILYEAPFGGPKVKVVIVAPGILIKYGGFADYSEEFRVLRFVRAMGSIQVPKAIQHTPLRRRQRSPSERHDIPGFGRKEMWYLCMERCQGVSLDKTISTMTSKELDHIAQQLKYILAQMASVQSRSFGSVTGGPYRNEFFPYHLPPQHAFERYSEFLEYYRNIMLYFCTESYTDQFLNKFPRHSPVRFTHGDLLPRNIIVDGSTITGIVDWATGGFYPEFWEYARMHEPGCVEANWKYVLGLVFPGPRRQAEINAVDQLLCMLRHNVM